jgi:hypothetical protein
LIPKNNKPATNTSIVIGLRKAVLIKFIII